MKLLRIAIVFGVFFPVAGWAHVCSSLDPNSCAYWTDSYGEFVRDGFGSCIRTSHWTEETQVVGCDAIPDTDGDGVFDDVDQCPGTAAGIAVGPTGCPLDSDGDGVTDDKDQCPGTAAGITVNAKGCPVDSDGDGVADHLDKCAATPAGARVDASGCPLDSDGDGVADYKDRCPGTRPGAVVNAQGCENDADADGVVDSQDRCPGSPAGAAVDTFGCVLDSDGDGVADYRDQCQGSPAGARVNANGCEIVITTVLEEKIDIVFPSNSTEIGSEYDAQFKVVADFMQSHPETRLIVEGHSDSVGSAAYNLKLSQRRADAVADYIAERHGIPRGRIQGQGFGESQPIADNATAAGRKANRRVVALVKAVVQR